MKKIYILTSLFFLSILHSANISHKLKKPTDLFIGTPFNLFIDIFVEEADSVFAMQKDTLDIFQVLDLQQSVALKENGVSHHEIIYTLAGFDIGKFDFPILEFLIKKPDNSTEIISTKSFVIYINSTAPDSISLLTDISEPQKLSFSFWEISLPIIILILIIVGIFYLRKFLKKPIKPKEEITTDTRPAWEKAMELYEILRKKQLLEKGDFLNFFFEISQILRFFLEHHYSFNALEMTTYEIKEVFEIEDKEEQREIIQILKYADLVKFSKFVPHPDESRKYFSQLGKYLKKQEKLYFNKKKM